MSRASGKASHLEIDLPKSLFGYDVVEYLGDGAGSRIYAVVDPQTSQLYALKHVVRTDEKSERYVEQLQSEFEVGRSVAHANLRRSIDLKINRNFFRKTIDAALILELFDGMSLEMRPTSSLLDTMDCFIQVARGLEALHGAGFVHCDLKPNNILRSQDGFVKVIDLGQACKTGVTKDRVQGTPDYMAPEQAKCAAVTNRTDIFNFGATLYWAVTGKNIPTLFRLKKGSNSFLLDNEIATPRQLNAGIPEPLSNLVMECVRNSQSKRPESMGDVASRLELLRLHQERVAERAAAALSDSGISDAASDSPAAPDRGGAYAVS